MMGRTNQPGRDNRDTFRCSPTFACGGVIARVQRSMRQKLKRPLKSILSASV
jgi:hypothetical protein